MLKLKSKSWREIITYGFVGVATTLINLGSYHLLLLGGCDYKLANFIAIVAAKVFAYLGNKFLVFRTHCDSVSAFCRELATYVAARAFTGVLDFFGLIIAVEFLHADPIWAKYVLQVLVIVANYFLGKYLVFTGKKTTTHENGQNAT